MCKALKVMVASLNRIRHSVGSHSFNWIQVHLKTVEKYENAGTSHCMLDTLKTRCVLKRSSIQNRVQLMKAIRNEC